MAEQPHATSSDDTPPHRYDAALAGTIETKWQQRWADEGTFHAPNPTGDLSEGFERVADRTKFFALDMFPYPSGSGLHVGHPLGYIGTDVFARYQRMTGHNVLHTMGYDAFGLPAEQYAIETGRHPRVTTEANIANMSRQLARLGLGHDRRRVLATTDVGYYRWTQWIFLQLFESFYDTGAGQARPIAELVAELDAGDREPDDHTLPAGTTWSTPSPQPRGPRVPRTSGPVARPTRRRRSTRTAPPRRAAPSATARPSRASSRACSRARSPSTRSTATRCRCSSRTTC
jgi:leucyl-tRNA synthetase